MFGNQFSLFNPRNISLGTNFTARKLIAGTVVTYQYYGLTKSGCPKHACLKEIHDAKKSLGDFPFGKVLYGRFDAAKGEFVTVADDRHH